VFLARTLLIQPPAISIPTRGKRVGQSSPGAVLVAAARALSFLHLWLSKRELERPGIRCKYITNTTFLASEKQTTLYPWPEVCRLFLKISEAEGTDRTDLR
jgi:hypothetical protein